MTDKNMKFKYLLQLKNERNLLLVPTLIALWFLGYHEIFWVWLGISVLGRIPSVIKIYKLEKRFKNRV